MVMVSDFIEVKNSLILFYFLCSVNEVFVKLCLLLSVPSKRYSIFSWVSRLLIIIFSDTLAKLYLCGDALQVYFHTIPDEIIEKLVIFVFFTEIGGCFCIISWNNVL